MMMSPRLFRVALLALSTASPAFAQSDTTRSTPALKDAFHGTFRIGTALAPRQFNGDDKRVVSLIRTHFNAISPENVLKWEVVHPLPDIYNFGTFSGEMALKCVRMRDTTRLSSPLN